MNKYCHTSSQFTRNFENNLYYETPMNTLVQRKPTTAISTYCNYLPIEMKICKSMTTFKMKLKWFLISKNCSVPQ